MLEMILAGVGLTVCALLLLRQMLPAVRRRRVDAAAQRCWAALHRLPERLRRRGKLERDIEREAQDVIDRARRRAKGSVKRDGNVYRPDAFRPSQPPPSGRDKLH